jgi:hypothetical protein
MTKSQEDIDWLLERMPQANEKQRETFAEKVAVCCCEGEMAEETARQQVFAWMVES